MTIYITHKTLKNKNLGKINSASRILIEANAREAAEVLLEEKIPEEEIWVYHSLIETDGELLCTEQILLDERYADGYLNIPKSAFERYGYLNETLPAKRRYELLLRLSNHYIVRGRKLEKELEFCEVEDEVERYIADCYILGKYSNLLQKIGCFEPIVQLLLAQVQNEDDKEWRLNCLEEMVGHKEAYWKIEDGIAPILVYYGVTYCYNIMNVLLGQLARALQEMGERIIVYDEQKEDVAGLSRFVDCRFKAVIGVQTYLMSVFMKESNFFLHDRIIGPKFNLILDHPIWLKKQLQNVPSKYYVLTHDENYRCFVEQYYPKVKKAYLFPPAGQQTEFNLERQNKKYELSFIGTYGNYRKKCEVIYKSNRNIRYLANRFLLYLRQNTELTAEAALEKTLSYYGIELEKEVFLRLFYEMRSVIQCVMYYYREKVIETLLKAKIKIDIWGESWEAAPMAADPYLIIHKEVSSCESMQVFRESKVSLNVMAWHKGGFTERMANIMLSGAVLLTDETTYSPQELADGRNCLMFSLKELNMLPDKVLCLLKDEGHRRKVAEEGYRYAKEFHTWEQRAERLIQIIGEIE